MHKKCLPRSAGVDGVAALIELASGAASIFCLTGLPISTSGITLTWPAFDG